MSAEPALYSFHLAVQARNVQITPIPVKDKDSRRFLKPLRLDSVTSEKASIGWRGTFSCLSPPGRGAAPCAPPEPLPPPQLAANPPEAPRDAVALYGIRDEQGTQVRASRCSRPTCSADAGTLFHAGTAPQGRLPMGARVSAASGTEAAL